MTFKAGKVWKVLQSMPGASSRQLAEQLKDTQHSVSDCLGFLAERGCVVSRGTFRGAVYRARWYATDKEPMDLRGCSLGSQKALKENKMPWPEALKMANKARLKKKIKPPKTIVFTTELERCWRNVVVLPQVGQVDETYD